MGKQSIKANPSKVKAVLETKPSKSKKEVEAWMGSLQPWSVLPQKEAFNQMKQHLASLPAISAPETGGTPSIYISIAENTISTALIFERNKVQIPVYFFKTSKLAEIKYSSLKKKTCSSPSANG